MLAAASTVANSAFGDSTEAPSTPSGPSDRLAVAVLGVRGRGASHLKAYAHHPHTEVTLICDPDQRIANKRADQLEKFQRRRPRVVSDLRRAIDSESVDIVSIATPNHWHALAAIWAMQANKDVYVEKPVSHSVVEGRRMVEVSRNCLRICQAGFQSRSNEGLQEAIRFLRQGQLGPLSVARGISFTPRKPIGNAGSFGIPAEMDYDQWLGPARFTELTRPSLHFDWQWQWAFGSGELGNRGVPLVDIARWGLGQDRLSDRVFSYGARVGGSDAGETPNTQVVYHEYDDQSLVLEIRGLKSVPRKNIADGVIFECEGGWLVVSGNSKAVAFGSNGRVIRKFSGRGDHFDNFIQAVRGRRLLSLNSDIEQGHLSSALCHFANISYRLGSVLPPEQAKHVLQSHKSRDAVAQTFDWTAKHLHENGIANADLQIGQQLQLVAGAERVVDCVEANQLLSVEYRSPFTLPDSNAPSPIVAPT